MITDYTSLVATIVLYAVRQGDDDFATLVPSFIQFAEKRSERRLRTREMESVATVTVTDEGVGALPDDFLQLREARVGDRVLNSVAVSSPITTWAYGGRAEAFTIADNDITLFPRGDADVEISYYGSIPPLSTANPTNWLLRKAPDLYLYGSLLEASPYLLDDARAGTWGTLFDRALNDVAAADVLSRYPRPTSRIQGVTP